MEIVKEDVLYRVSEIIKLEKEFEIMIRNIRDKFNSFFRKHNIDMYITLASVIEKYDEDEVINEFFLFPVQKLFLSDGVKEEEFGVRVLAVKKIKKKKFEVCILDIKNSMLEKSDWLSSNLLEKDFRLDKNSSFLKHYQEYLLAMKKVGGKILKDKPKIIYTDKTGWIKGGMKWSYVPLTPPDFDNLIYNSKLSTKYKIRVDEKRTPQQAFQSVYKMLDIADKKLTISLLSYTFLSLVTSLIKYNESNLQKFLICIYGKNKDLKREGFANIFCNIFNRNRTVNSINSEFHSNLNCTDEELRIRSQRIKDGDTMSRV